MKTAYFNCPAGISGDMCLGALLDAGASLPLLHEQLAMLSIDGYQLTAVPSEKSSIRATQALVSCSRNAAPRHLAEILDLIRSSALSPWAKDKSCLIFQRLAEAEAAVHGVLPEEIHFHEVGAVDAIVDIVGTVILLDQLGVEKVCASPLPMGHGFVRCAHGLLPLPAPATQQLLLGVPVYGVQQEGELVTPTGAAIISTLAESFGPMPEMTVQRLGYGAGSHDFPFPNLLQVSLGELRRSEERDTVLVMETAIDDMNPEIFSRLWELLFSAGALDVYLTAAQMKKGRPGTLLTVLCPPDRQEDLAALLFRETTTLGIRCRQEQRLLARRQVIQVDTPHGTCRVKVSSYAGQLNIAPEFEDCRRLAQEADLPLKEIYATVGAAARLRLENRPHSDFTLGAIDDEN